MDEKSIFDGKANLSNTIPQIFYDIIARLIPGFAFYSVLRLLILGIDLKFPTIYAIESSLIMLFVYSILFYLIGWFLTCLLYLFKETWFGSITKSKKFNLDLENKLTEKNISYSHMFQKVRLYNEGKKMLKLVGLNKWQRYIQFICNLGKFQ